MKPSLPQGMRDFLPKALQKRNYIFDTIRTVMELYAFVPIETPSVENLSTLLGKYGDEGDKLIFKILNNGDYLKKADKAAIDKLDSDGLSGSISKRGLRYDLTVPFARYVVMNQNELAFPFKRYQIQPVWRADRPQKNRYREFFQCDADVIGSRSMLYEAELTQIYDEVFSRLNLPVNIRINNRKILSAIITEIAPNAPVSGIIGAIDKIDKIGIDKVIDQVASRNEGANVSLLRSYLECKTLDDLTGLSLNSIELNTGVSELREVFNYIDLKSVKNNIVFDPTLARGLDYYTGCIYEVCAIHNPSVSIGGGGRYDNLTEIFGLKNMSGVGISFGADRIYNMLDEENLWPAADNQNSVTLIATDSEEALRAGYRLAQTLRAQEIAVSVYPEATKWKKQFKYADQISARYVIIIGQRELEEKRYQVKNMMTGDQNSYDIGGIAEYLST